MISLQTNVTSLMAQQNLNTDNAFQSKTIEELTSGYRINSSGDDAAGLAIANGYRSSVSELTQGIANANDGTSQMQIIDGGLSNISTILDRMKTLATQSASGTFTGSRATLNQEYAGLITEVNRQAANINLNAGGTFNTNLSVYIGGAGATQSNASVNIDLSGSSNAVDATSLGLQNTNVLEGGAGIAGNSLRIDAAGATFVKGTAGTNDQSFTFNVFSGGNAQTVTATVAASAAGSTLTSALSSLNGQLNQYGITAGTDSNGLLQFSGASAFSVTTNGTVGGSNLLTNENTLDGAAAYTANAAGDTLTLTNANGISAVVTSTATNNTLAGTLAAINAQTATTGISAVVNAAGTGINLVGGGAFTAVNSAAKGVFGGLTAATTSTSNAAGTIDGATTGSFIAGNAGNTLTFTNSTGGTNVVTLVAGDTTQALTIADINAQNAAAGFKGVTAVSNASGGGINFVGNGSFNVVASGVDAFAAAGTFTTTSGTAENTSNYRIDGANTYTKPAANSPETLQFQTAGGTAQSVVLAAGTTLNAAISQINAQTSTLGVFAVANAAGTGITFLGANSFSVNDSTKTANQAGVFAAQGANLFSSNTTATAPTTGATSNGTSSITSIDAAIANLGLVQGSVGAGENKLQYASNLAQSQISSYSAAESQIRDADIAAQAANLTKAQVLVQTSVAALAQANSAPQSILKLLQ